MPFEAAAVSLKEWRTNNPSSGLTTIEWYLTRRYETEKKVRDAFIAIGGKPKRDAPVYFTLDANEKHENLV